MSVPPDKAAADRATTIPCGLAPSGGGAAPDPAAAIERRATVRLERYWMALRRGGIAPSFHDFDPRRNPVPWENCFLARLGSAPGAVVFDHVGGALWAAVDRAAPSDPESAGVPEFLAPLIGEVVGVLATGRAAELSGAYPLGAGRVLLFRSILLPFLDGAGQPRYGFGAATFRTAPVP